MLTLTAQDISAVGGRPAWENSSLPSTIEGKPIGNLAHTIFSKVKAYIKNNFEILYLRCRRDKNAVFSR